MTLPICVTDEYCALRLLSLVAWCMIFKGSRCNRGNGLLVDNSSVVLVVLFAMEFCITDDIVMLLWVGSSGGIITVVLVCGAGVWVVITICGGGCDIVCVF